VSKRLLAERMAHNKLRTTAAVKETVTRAAWLQAPYACDPIVSSAVEAPSRKNLVNGLSEMHGDFNGAMSGPHHMRFVYVLPRAAAASSIVPKWPRKI